jgi:hypothetical protein
MARLNEQFRRMQKLAGIITEDQLGEIQNQDLLQFIDQNQNEILNILKSTNNENISGLKNISYDAEGDVSATIVLNDYEMVSSDSATFMLDGKIYNLKDILSNPNMFLNKTVEFKYGESFKPTKKKIGIIDKEYNMVGFPEKRITGSDISFSTNPITDGEESGKMEVNGETLYWTIYDV